MRTNPKVTLLGLLAGFAATLAAAPDSPAPAKPPVPPAARISEITIDDYSDIIESPKAREAAAKAEAQAAEEAAAAARLPRVRRAIAIPGAVVQRTELGDAQFLTTRGIEVLTIDHEGHLQLPDNVYSPAQLSRLPAAKLQIKPQYPFELRRQGVGGVVTVKFIVDRDGNVSAAWATRSSQPDFERNAVDAVIRWKFVPGRVRSGAAVDTEMVVDIVFNLSDRGAPTPRLPAIRLLRPQNPLAVL